MPRLSSAILRRAGRENGHLPHLLRECRDLASARNELRWLREATLGPAEEHPLPQTVRAHDRLRQYVKRRSKGEPLQYILGNQPFGELEIQCCPGVLIPRPETEVYTAKLARVILSSIESGHLIRGNERLRIADLCTGTGCIALLLHSLLRPMACKTCSPPKELCIVGADISSTALDLANQNLTTNVQAQLLAATARSEIKFRHLDVLELGSAAAGGPALAVDLPAQPASASVPSSMRNFLGQSWPIIVSNPPYISPADYAPGGTTMQSVRRYEPKLALVPPELKIDTPLRAVANASVNQADQFYVALLHVAYMTHTKLLVMEIGDFEQSERVIWLARHILGNPSGEADPSFRIEVWRDDDSEEIWHRPQLVSPESEANNSTVNRRAVVIWRGDLANWRSSTDFAA